MQGWIKLHRQFTEWEWYTDLKTKSLFLHLLLTANIADRKCMGFMVHPGQSITTLPRLAAETGLTEMEVRTAIKHLKKTGEISEKVTNKFRLITIEKWAFYQGMCLESNRQLTDNQQTNNRQLTGVEEEEKEEKELPTILPTILPVPSADIPTSTDIPTELMGMSIKELMRVRENWRAAGRIEEWVNAYGHVIDQNKNNPSEGA